MKSKIALAATLSSSFALFAGCSEEAATDELQALSTPVRFVIRHSDTISYASSAFTLLDAQGEIVADGYIHSDSTPVGLTAALSGDTDVPTLSEPGVLSILDRYGMDTLTRIDLSTGQVLGQVRTQGVSASGFSGNPQDVAYVSATSAWVSRYSYNSAGEGDDVAGSDLLEIDPSTMTRTGARVSLASLDTSVMITGTSGPVTVTARPRPARMVRVGNFLAVGLDLITDGWETAAPGKLAIVDLTTHALTTHDLSPLTNCGAIQPVPGEVTQVAVVCKGYTDRTVESGLVVLSIDGTTGVVSEVASYLSSDHPSDAYVFDSVTLLNDGTFLGVHLGGWSPSDPPDSLVRVTLADGSRETVFEAGHAQDLFVTMAFDPATGLILVPDHSVGVRRLTLGSSGDITVGTAIRPRGHGLTAIAASVFP